MPLLPRIAGIPMTPATKRTMSSRTAAATVALLLPALAVPAWQASALPDAGDSPTPAGRPGPATTTTHDLAPADRIPGAGSLSRVDAAEAMEHARGRAVEVVSATDPVDLPELAVVGVTWDGGSAHGWDCAVPHRRVRQLVRVGVPRRGG